MQYILPTMLMVFSYIFAVYFGHQASRSVIDRPLIYNNRIILLILAILFAVVPIVAAIFLSFKDVGLFFALILIVIRFIVLPPLFSSKIRILLDKSGF